MNPVNKSIFTIKRGMKEKIKMIERSGTNFKEMILHETTEHHALIFSES